MTSRVAKGPTMVRTETTESTEAPESEVLAKLRDCATRLARSDEDHDLLMTERLDLYRQAKDLGASWRSIARAAGVSDVAVLRALQRADEVVARNTDEVVGG